MTRDFEYEAKMSSPVEKDLNQLEDMLYGLSSSLDRTDRKLTVTKKSLEDEELLRATSSSPGKSQEFIEAQVDFYRGHAEVSLSRANNFRTSYAAEELLEFTEDEYSIMEAELPKRFPRS